MTKFHPFPRQDITFTKSLRIPQIKEFLVGRQDEMPDNKILVAHITSGVIYQEVEFTRKLYLENVVKHFTLALHHMKSSDTEDSQTIRIICNSDTWNIIYDCLQEGAYLLDFHGWYSK